MKYLEQLFLAAAILMVAASYTLNFYFLGETEKQIEHKKEILRLTEKRNSSNPALKTVYQDSINNAVINWLENGTVK